MPFNSHNQYSDSEPNAPPRAPAIVLARGLAVVNHPPVIIRRCTLLQTLFKKPETAWAHFLPRPYCIRRRAGALPPPACMREPPPPARAVQGGPSPRERSKIFESSRAPGYSTAPVLKNPADPVPIDLFLHLHFHHFTHRNHLRCRARLSPLHISQDVRGAARSGCPAEEGSDRLARGLWGWIRFTHA